MGTPRAFETKRDANSTCHILHYLLTDDGTDRGSALHPDSTAPIVPVLRVGRILGDAIGDIGHGAPDLLLVGYDIFQRPIFTRRCHIGR